MSTSIGANNQAAVLKSYNTDKSSCNLPELDRTERRYLSKANSFRACAVAAATAVASGTSESEVVATHQRIKS